MSKLKEKYKKIKEKSIQVWFTLKDNKSMRKYCILILFIFGFYSLKPVSLEDKEVEILYLCDCNGQFEFDNEGRSGLATLSELKRRESERLKSQNGMVLLFSGGNFFGKGKDMRSNFKLLSQVPFDAVFLTDEELAYLDINLALKSLNLPLVTSRKNSFGIDGKKEFVLGDVNLTVNDSSYKGEESSSRKNVRVIFSTEEEKREFSNSDFLILIGHKEKMSSYYYKSGVHFAECPSYKNSIGKINLTFRNGEIIRHSQEFVFLNSDDRNRSWIEPNREIANELK